MAKKKPNPFADKADAAQGKPPATQATKSKMKAGEMKGKGAKGKSGKGC